MKKKHPFFAVSLKAQICVYTKGGGPAKIITYNNSPLIHLISNEDEPRIPDLNEGTFHFYYILYNILF